MREEKLLRKVLEENNAKVTTPRLEVFRLLLGREPQTLAELINKTKGKVNRVSVYRVVDLFEKLGIVRRVTIGWKYKIELSEIFLDHHHHITCLSCHKIVGIKADKTLEMIIDGLSKESGFWISSHQLEIQGYCQQCQELRR